MVKLCRKFEWNRIIPSWVIHNLLNFCRRYVSLWPWPLTPWPWTFVVLRVSRVQALYKIWAKSSNPWRSYWPFSTFSPYSSRVRVALSPDCSLVCMDQTSPNLARSYCDHRCVISLFQSWDILLHFQTPEPQSWATLKIDAKFRTF